MPPRARKSTESASVEQSELAVSAPADDRPASKATPKAAPGAAVKPVPVLDRWVQTAGHPTHTFCQTCLPSGPPEGAGVIGCPHSTWVFVRGGA